MFCCCCCCFGDFGLSSCFGSSENNTKNCCSYFTEKIFQIIFIMAYIFLMIFLIATLSIIKWSKFPSVNITFFIFIFFLILACLILGILIYFYTQNSRVDDKVKEKISLISKIGIIITIISLILSIIEEIIISVGFSQASSVYPCDDIDVSFSTSVSVGFFVLKRNFTNFGTNTNIKRILDTNDDDCFLFFVTGPVLGMTYFTLTMIELISLIAILFWRQHKNVYYPNPVVQNYNPAFNTHNQNNPQEIVVQIPQIIVVNQGNNGQNSQQNNFNGDNLNQNNNNGNNKNINNKGVTYPSQQEVINNNGKEGQKNQNLNNNQNQALNLNNKENSTERKNIF